MVPEALFQPALVGRESETTHGLSQIAFDCINNSPIDLRKQFYETIILSGGSSMFPGLVEVGWWRSFRCFFFFFGFFF